MERIDKLRIECQTTFGVRLDSRCRSQKFTEARAVFAVLARRFGYKLKDIGAVTGRTHASTINSIKQHPYLGKGVQNITNRIYEACLTNDETVKLMARRMEQMDYLTENEKIYRTLTAHQKAIYDERVTNLLKMI